VIIREVDWDDPAGVALRTAQRDELTIRYEDPNSEPGPAPTADDMTLFLVALEDDGSTPIACGGLRRIDDMHGEIKRMYVTPERRGRGVATAILRELERRARGLGWGRLVLETGDRQPDAIRFYEREGYSAIPRYGHYVNSALSRCYARSL
jgi:putative acetyltransferase